MRWKMPNGKEVTHKDSQYRIDFNKKAPSKLAQIFKDWIKENAPHYIWYDEYRLPGGLLRVDFLCSSKRVCFEINGEQHTKFVPFFHGSRNALKDQIKRDIQKIKFLEDNNFRVIELEEKDLKQLSREYLKKNFNVIF